MKISNNMRLPAADKNYWVAQMQRFADSLNQAEIMAVQYGKQDVRGTESITLVDHDHCVPKQIHFPNKWALLGYIQGYNESINPAFRDQWHQFRKSA